jgi:siroheme synthase
VILMGFGRRVELTAQLILAGWDAATPAAIVSDGTLPTQQTWRGTLGDVASGRATLETDGPAVIVIGAVAALALDGAATRLPGVRDADAEMTERSPRAARRQRT